MTLLRQGYGGRGPANPAKPEGQSRMHEVLHETMPRKIAEMVARWRAEDAAKGVDFHLPQWPGRFPDIAPDEIWSADSKRKEWRR
jgi:hypothetical protein